ncbi:MAG: sigma-54-dependent Fis family transcriptional regulator, partial [Bacteroidetes bacterium]|nr:sigma-54-dependent Fis family transcriptional regulator [Bacteroidota bacterium]
KERNLTAEHLQNYIPKEAGSTLPMRIQNQNKDDFSERDILYKVLFDMKKDMTDLKKLVAEIIQNGGNTSSIQSNQNVINQLYRDIEIPGGSNNLSDPHQLVIHQPNNDKSYDMMDEAEEVEESLSLVDKESDLIKKALKKHKGKRKLAAQELGISERTLYRKIKELEL